MDGYTAIPQDVDRATKLSKIHSDQVVMIVRAARATSRFIKARGRYAADWLF